MSGHNKFPDIKGLDNELALIRKQLNEGIGKEVDKLPPLSQVTQSARFFVKQSDGTYKKFVKIGNDFVEDQKGEKGDTGADGATGPAGADGATGEGVPTGGTAGQVLSKINSTDYNTQWSTISSGGNILLASTYDPDATSGILICEKYDPTA